MENYTGAELVVGQCYMYKGKNMGKFIKFEITGRQYDPDEKYTFENGIINQEEFLQRQKVFTKVPCSGGGARRKRVTRKRISTKRKSRRNRATRRYKKHRR
jgi:hypothetical protein